MRRYLVSRKINGMTEERRGLTKKESRELFESYCKSTDGVTSVSWGCESIPEYIKRLKKEMKEAKKDAQF